MKLPSAVSLFFFYLASIPPILFAQTLEPADSLALVNLIFTDMSKNPRIGDSVFFTSARTGSVFSSETDSAGKMSLLLPRGDTYLNTIHITDGDTVDFGKVELRPGKSKMTVDLVREYSVKTFVLENVFFDFGKASLKKESFPALDELYESLKFNDSMVVEIAGHTDNVGSEENNLKLSQARADSVRAYLLRKGIEPERVLAKGYGESQPVADNHTRKSRQLNRRTEVRVLKE